MGTVIACVICLMMGGCMGFIVSGLIFAEAIKKAHEELDRERKARRPRPYIDYSNPESIKEYEEWRKENSLDEYRL